MGEQAEGLVRVIGTFFEIWLECRRQIDMNIKQILWLSIKVKLFVLFYMVIMNQLCRSRLRLYGVRCTPHTSDDIRVST